MKSDLLMAGKAQKKVTVNKSGARKDCEKRLIDKIILNALSEKELSEFGVKTDGALLRVKFAGNDAPSLEDKLVKIAVSEER